MRIRIHINPLSNRKVVGKRRKGQCSRLIIPRGARKERGPGRYPSGGMSIALRWRTGRATPPTSYSLSVAPLPARQLQPALHVPYNLAAAAHLSRDVGLWVVDVAQLVDCRQAPVGVTGQAQIPAIILCFLPVHIAAVILLRPHQSGCGVCPDLVCILNRGLLPCLLRGFLPGLSCSLVSRLLCHLVLCLLHGLDPRVAHRL